MANRVNAAVTLHMMARNLAQWQVAAELGISPSLLSHWSQGRRIPNVAARKTLATYFGFSDPNEMIGHADEAFCEQIYEKAREMV